MAFPQRPRKHAVLRGLRALVRERRGATAIEYGLILALITLTIMTALIGVAEVTTNMWGNINSKVERAR